jgi:SAM-dependent methyltransferase
MCQLRASNRFLQPKGRNFPNLNMVTEYGKVEYWDSYYASKARNFEWLGTYELFADFMAKYFPTSVGLEGANVFLPGCGNSEMAYDLLSDKSLNCGKIVGVDYSESVIKQMRASNLNPKIAYRVHNCLEEIQPEFRNAFDVVIDKSTLDAICCREPAEDDAGLEYHPDGVLYLQRMAEILKPGGSLIILSYSSERVHEIRQVTSISGFYEKIYCHDKIRIINNDSSSIHQPDIFNHCYFLKTVLLKPQKVHGHSTPL